MHPESLHRSRITHSFGNGQQNSLNNAAEVTHVEQIMGLGGRRQKNFNCLLVHFQSSRNNLLTNWPKLVGKAPNTDKNNVSCSGKNGQGRIIQVE